MTASYPVPGVDYLPARIPPALTVDDIGPLVKELRKAHHWSCERLAAEAGVARAYVSLVESGARVPHTPKLIAILECAGRRPCGGEAAMTTRFAAAQARKARLVGKAAQLAADPTLARHGRPGTYTNWGCRCDECRAAWSAYFRVYRAGGVR